MTRFLFVKLAHVSDFPLGTRPQTSVKNLVSFSNDRLSDWFDFYQYKNILINQIYEKFGVFLRPQI